MCWFRNWSLKLNLTGWISTTTLWVFFPQLWVSMHGFSYLVDMWQCFCYLKVRLCGRLIPGSYLEPWGWSHESFSFLLISMKNKKGGGESGNHSHVILWHNNVTAIIAQVVMHSHSHVTGWFRTLQYFYYVWDLGMAQTATSRQTLQRMCIPVEACGVSSAECLVGV